MRQDNIAMLQETLQILDRGSYEVNGKTVSLKLSRERMERCHVLLPENVQEICGRELKRSLRLILRFFSVSSPRFFMASINARFLTC